MRSKAVIVGLLFSLASFSAVYSEEGNLEGEIGATGYYVDLKGEEGGKAKFTEYKDVEEHWRFLGKAGVETDSETRFLKFKAYDMGYDTQRYTVDGGQWGKFKANVFYDEIPHNITHGARTFYSGAGGDTLASPENPSLNFNTWNTFDYSTERRKLGGGMKLETLKPFYFDASYSREEKKGIKPAGIAANPASPGTFAIEFPEPVDYTTSNLKLEGGYAKNPLFLSFNYLYSTFDNDIQTLRFVGFPAFDPETNFLTLPPPNSHHKFAFKGALKLPYNSKFSSNLAGGKTTSDHDFFQTFDGEVKTNNADFVLTSNPVRFLDTKIYYKHYERDNKSAQSLLAEPEDVPHFFDYKLDTFGIEAGFRFPGRLYLRPGYRHVKTEREFVGVEPEKALPFNKDNIYSLELKWTGLDFLSARVGYERLDREADFRTFTSDFLAETGELASPFIFSPQERDTYKLLIDLYPVEQLSLGLGYKLKRTDYKDDILARISGLDRLIGITKDTRDEFSFSADYNLGTATRLFGYLDYEKLRFDHTHFKHASGFSPGEGFWTEDQEEKTFAYGIGADIYVIPNKLTFAVLYDYIKSDGFSDITIFDADVFPSAGPGANNDNIDISNLCDYTKRGFSFKAIYYATRTVTLTGGYAYERFNFSSAELDDYQFVNPSGGPVTGTNGAFLTGAYKDQSYRANMIFAGLTYKF